MNTLTQNFPQDLYKVVMDSSMNPLAALPKMVRFQFMSMLAFMWSGLFFTADTFRRARKIAASQKG